MKTDNDGIYQIEMLQNLVIEILLSHVKWIN